jgi:hypothetical protein
MALGSLPEEGHFVWKRALGSMMARISGKPAWLSVSGLGEPFLFGADAWAPMMPTGGFDMDARFKFPTGQI